MTRSRALLLLIVALLALICVTYKAGDAPKTGAIAPKSDTWLYGSAQTADGVNMAGVTVSRNSRSSTTNVSGSWGFYYPLGANQRYTLDIQLPEGYMMTDVLGPGVTGWSQDSLTFQTGTVGQLQGPYQIIITQVTCPTETPYATPTPDPNLQPPSIWPWPIMVPSEADAMLIADKAREVRGQPLEPIAEMQDNKLWQRAWAYQLGAQLGPEYRIEGDSAYRCMEFTQGIIVMYPGDDTRFGVVSPFGSWATYHK